MSECTLVSAERTAATMTMSLSFFARTAALPDAEGEFFWMVDAITVGIEVEWGKGN